MSETTYGVTGATGQLGRLVIEELRRTVEPGQIVAIVRDAKKARYLTEQGVEVRVATYQDTDSLAKAMVGIDTLLLISSSDLSSSRFEQHKNVIDAAKNAGVSKVGYTSLLHLDERNPLTPDHKATEAYLQASGLGYVILRHGWYTENYVDTAMSAIQSGVVLTSAGSGKVSSATRADFAAADVAAIQDDSKDIIYELAGDEAWDFTELCSVISRISSKEVVLQNMTTKEHIEALMDFGLDESTASFVAALDGAIAAGGLEDTGHQLSQLIGRPTTNLQDRLKAAL